MLEIQPTEKASTAKTDAKPKEVDVSMSKLMSYYSPKWLAYLGMLMSLANGAAFPIYGLLFGEILFVILMP